MRFYLLFASILALLPLCVQGQTANFAQGVSQLESSHFAEAQVEFQKALDQQPNNPKILFNLGLSFFKQNKKSLAASYWRKALAQQPNLKEAKKGMTLLEKDLVPPTDELSFFMQAQTSTVSIPWPLIFTVALLVFNLLGYFGFKKNVLAVWLLAAALLIVIAVGSLKYLDSQIPRATVIENQKLKAGPDANAPEVLDVLETQEVVILQKHEDWIQIKIGNDTFGWLPKSSLIQTMGPSQW